MFARIAAKSVTRIALIVIAGTLAFGPGAAAAKPTAYVLNAAASIVGFETDFGTDKIRGQFPIDSANVAIDFSNMSQTTVSVTLNAAGGQASFPFAAEAMKGPKNLDTAEFPTITFTSSKVVANGDSAAVEGMITIRGVTRPLTMQAQLFQVAGEAKGDYSHLTIALSSAVNRSEFGAKGWSDMVGDQVRIHILARIDQAP
jgi:polyisoprenoid-binding protein YceI